MCSFRDKSGLTRQQRPLLPATQSRRRNCQRLYPGSPRFLEAVGAVALAAAVAPVVVLAALVCWLLTTAHPRAGAGASLRSQTSESLIDLPFINHEASPFHDEPQTEIEGCTHEPRASGNYFNSSAACT